MTAQVLFNHKGTRRHLARFHRDGERGPVHEAFCGQAHDTLTEFRDRLVLLGGLTPDRIARRVLAANRAPLCKSCVRNAAKAGRLPEGLTT